MNILFIMYDQLRFDYLSCSGHPHLDTLNFDRVAAMGVRFTQTYVQSPICGASRMCHYTGRYANAGDSDKQIASGWMFRNALGSSDVSARDQI